MGLLDTTLGATGVGGSGALGTLFVRLTADSTGIVRGFRQAEQTIESGSRRLIKQTALLAAGVTASLTAVAAMSLREFIQFESSFAGVRKTVNATEEEFNRLSQSFRDMAKQLPINVNEINKIAESAGQLGIRTKNIEQFTRTMIDLGNTTNLAGDVAATQLARLANITQMSQDSFDRLGSTIVALGNNLATTEAEIVEMAMRIAGAGTQIGLTEDQILSFAGALSSVGIQAEAGGTAISRLMVEMAKAVAQGSKELETFAATAGMTAEEFSKSFRENATDAILKFLQGLKAASDAGVDVFTVLERMGLDGTRLTDVMLRASGAGTLFANALKLGSTAWKENTALADEAAKRYETTASQLQITMNTVRDLMITIGEGLAPTLISLNKDLQELTKSNTASNASLKESANIIGGALIQALKAVAFIFSGIRDLLKVLAIGIIAFAEQWLKIFQTISGTIVKVLNFTVDKARTAINFLIEMANVLIREIPQKMRDLVGLQTLPQVKAFSFFVDEDKLEETIQTLKLAREELWDSLVKTSMGVADAVEEPTKAIGESFENMAEKVTTAIQESTAGVQKLKMQQDSEMVMALLKNLGVPEGGFGIGAEQTGMAGLGDPLTSQSFAIQNEIQMQQDKLKVLEELANQELELTEEVQKAKEKAIEAFNQRLKELNLAQIQIVVQSGQQMFDALGEAVAGFAGEQSAAYKAMFAASKAFAIAESIIKIQQGVASALALPFPANLAAMASVVAAAANIVSTIKSTEMVISGERAQGGPVTGGRSYLVGEQGPEVFTPSSNGDIIPNDMLGGGGSNVRVNINNYTDAKPEVRERDDNGTKVIDVIIRRVKGELSSEIRDGRGDVSKSLESSFGLRRGK